MTEATSQTDNITPAELGACFVVALEAESNSYDLSLLDFGGATFAKSGGSYLYLKMLSDVDAYYFFSPTDDGTVDETAALEAGGTAAFTEDGCDKLIANVPEPVRIHRTRHRWLVVKGSDAGILRVRASSHLSPRPTR